MCDDIKCSKLINKARANIVLFVLTKAAIIQSNMSSLCIESIFSVLGFDILYSYHSSLLSTRKLFSFRGQVYLCPVTFTDQWQHHARKAHWITSHFDANIFALVCIINGLKWFIQRRKLLFKTKMDNQVSPYTSLKLSNE